MKSSKKVVLQTVIEAEYGVDPGAGYTALLAKAGTEIADTGEAVSRETLRDTLSKTGSVLGKKQTSITLPLELRGAGDAGGGNLNTPEIDGILQACLMKKEDALVITAGSVVGTFEIGENVTNSTQAEPIGIVADVVGTLVFIRTLANAPADTDAFVGDDSGATATVTSSVNAIGYRPTSPAADEQASVTAQYYMDGIKHVVTGARGTFSIDLTNGQIPAINATLSGVYTAATDSSNPAVTYLDLIPTPVVGATLKIGDLDMSTVTVTAVSIDIGNDVQPRENIMAADGIEGFVVVDRAPTGSIDPEVTDIADFNPRSDWASGAKSPVSIGIGNAFGSRIRVIQPATQYTELPYADRNGIATYNLGYEATGNDDELMIIYW